MPHSLPDIPLRRDELCDVLQFDRRVIDALVVSGALPTRKEAATVVVDASQLERLFRDALMRVYVAQASRAALAAAAPAAVEAVTAEDVAVEQEFELEGEELPVITRTIDEHLKPDEAEAEPERPDLRLGARYVPRRQIGGVFRDVKFTILQLSNSGLRIRHSEPLRPGEEARLSFAILNPQRSFVIRARVAWTSIAQRGDGPSFYISGLRALDNADRLSTAAQLMRDARDLQLDPSDTGRRRTASRNVPRPVSGLPDEDVVAIIRAVRKLTADPAEATRWYTRARFAIADEQVRRDAPRGAREREEVIGVWEYLQRRIDLRAVAGVVQWIRSSRVAAV